MPNPDCPPKQQQNPVITDAHLSKIADLILARMAKDPRFKGPPGPPGKDGTDGANGKDGKGADVDLSGILKQLAEQKAMLDALAKKLENPQPTNNDSLNLILYYTSRSCDKCKQVDARIEKMKGEGWPIVITRLAPQDAETQGVPRLYMPYRKKHVSGISNIQSFLTNLVRR